MTASPATTAILLAFAASCCFSTASIVFARFSKQISSAWMNTVKVAVCWLALCGALLITSTWTTASMVSIGALFISGGIGLGIGDLFLLRGFARMGASRTILVFGFQPVVMAIAGSFLFGQKLEWTHAAAMFFFLMCLFLLSLERYKSEGHWEIKGLLFALAGVLLDNVGVLLTRWSFDLSPSLDPLQANLYRCTGALIVFGVLSFIQPIQLIAKFRELNRRDQLLAVGASFFGTFLSLSFYLSALKFGHLGTLSALVLTGPLISGLIECWLQRKWPSKYLIFGFGCLIAGMTLALGVFN